MSPAVHGSTSSKGRPGQEALQAFRRFQRKLSPRGQKYAEAYWRHRRRAAVRRPDPKRYGVGQVTAETIEAAINAVIDAYSR